LIVPAASRWALPAVFFLLTVASTLFVGGMQGIEYWSPGFFDRERSALEILAAIAAHGAPFSFAVLAIVFSHEMGHYLTARYYRIDSSLPFFIPFPISLSGTLGAFIVIKSRFPHRKALLDVGLAGPFAGFFVLLPLLYIGVKLSSIIRPEPGEQLLGEPLLFQWMVSWFGPAVPEGYALYASPVAIAAWFGLLLTALNLIPIGQLDGGHASYALLRGGAHRLSSWAFFAFIPLAYFGPSWLFWAFLLYVLGIRRPHPPTRIDEVPPPRSRYAMGALALAVFVLCFTPEPIVVSWREIWEALTVWVRG
jgi:membrane-associated protease RseP (regulator of RpoE activity)